MSEQVERDALVIGGNLAGISIAHWLASFGYRTTLFEKAPFLGGVDGSFENELGRTFDFGVHALDHGRNEFVTRLMEKAVRGKYRRLPKRRAILLGGHMIPYNAPLALWPDDLRALFRAGEIVDDLGTDPPTREALGRIYGERWADYVFDEILASYPAEQLQTQFGVDESQLLVNIYPWFFPRVERRGRKDDAHHRYQTKVRSEGGEHVIYPESGGFVGFAQGLADVAVEHGAELLVGANDLEVELDDERRRVRAVHAGGRRFTAPRVYWCGPPKVLLQLLGAPYFDATPETFALGSFQFERPVTCEYLELIGGDRRHLIKRASFPGKLQGGPDDLVQIEYHFPRGDEQSGTEQYRTERSWWLESWLESLRALGIVERDNEVRSLDLKLIPMHYNGFGIEGQPTPEVELPDLPDDTNLRPVLPSYRKININTRLPQYLRYLAEDLTR
ncbi:MAG: NAD(P)-binding protein [Planctomycetota bacterium]